MDGISLLNLTKHGFDLPRALRMNESLMGPRGYDFMYGSELPVYEFSSYEDKWGTKKSLTIWAKPIAHLMSVEAYGSGAIKVSSHYKFNVGTSYAMCSQLVFAAANALYTNAPAEEMDNLVKACVVAWRGVYEGLGLSGYTPDASRFFELLRYTAYSHVDGTIKLVNDELTYGFVKTGKNDTVKELNGFLELQKHFPHLSIAVIQRLVKARAISICYRKIENKGVGSIHPKSAMYALIPAAIVSGTLRRLGQGADPVEIVADFEVGMADEESPDSLFSLFVQRNLGAKLGNPILGAVASKGALLHSAVSEELAARSAEDLF